MKKIYSFLSLCLLFLGLTTATAQTAELKLTFDRTGDNVSVSVAGLDGVTASVVSKSHDWKDLGVANANTVLCPNVNGNTDPTITWGIQLNGVPANYKLKGMALDIHALNGAGQYQDPADNVNRHWNVAVAQGETPVANFADIEISQGTEEGRTMGNNHKVHSVAAAEALAATDPMTLNFTVTKGSENKGCFFGLSEVTLAYEVEEVVEPEPEVPATPVVITEVAQLSNAKCYTLVSADTGRGGMYALADKVDMCGVTYNQAQTCHGVARDNADPKQQFAFVEYEGKHYLYSVSEKKFVMKSGDTNALVGEAPFEFVTVEKVGESTFALKANDTNYFTASPGWCANPSRGTCVQSTLTSKSKDDGWDEGAWFTITEVADFNADEAIAMLTPAAPVVEPLALVKANPELETEVTSLNSITLTFNKEIASVSAEPYMFWFVNADMTNMYDAEVQINATDAKTLTITLAEEIKEAGTYIAMFSQGALVAADGTSNETAVEMAWTVKPEVVEPEPTALELVKANPELETEVSSLGSITLTFNKEIASVTLNESTFYFMATDFSKVFTTADVQVNATDAKSVTLTLPEVITAEGEYVAMLMNGAVVATDGTSNQGIVELAWTVKAAPAVEPLQFVSIDPANGSELSSVTKFTLTFNKPVTLKNAEGATLHANGGSTTLQVLISETDAKEVVLAADKEITNSGSYELKLAEGTLEDADGGLNEALTFTYEVESANNTLNVVKTNPDVNVPQETLKRIILTFDGDVMDYDTHATVNVTDASGTVVTTGRMDFTDAWEEILITLNNEIGTPGKYTVTVPENTIFGYGTFNPEINLTYTIGAETTTVVAVDPACGHYENMPANLKLTFSNDIKTLEFGMLRTDFTGVRGYTLAEEDYTIAGNELTINVPADYVNGAANMMLTLAVIDVNDQYVTYAYDEAELNQDYVVLMYTADMKSDLFVMESSDPEAGVVEKLDVINVTFGNGGYTYVGGFDKSKEVVVLNADEEVVAKAAMEVVEMTETEDGETFSWPTSTVKFTLDTPVTEAGEYTLVIPEATVYNEGYYEEAEDFGASYGAIYNPEVRIEYTIEGEAVLDYTPLHNGSKTRSDRNVTAVKLNSILGNNVYYLTSMESSQDYTDATAVATFKVAAGEELTAVVEHAGEWVHHAVYVDLDANGFNASLEEGSEWKPAGDLMAYAFYNNGGSSDEYGYNSVGTSLSGQDRHMPSLPAFNAPTQPGTYRMRFVQTWCSIDPNGDNDGKFGDFKNNGDQIVDVLLEVVDATGINSIGVDANNDVYTLDGRQVNVQAGKKLNKGIYIVGGKKVYVK